jgi:hypothetical protein
VAAKAVNGPDDFNIHQIGIQNARRDETMREQRFGLVHAQTVDDTILSGIQTRANRLGEIGMIGQNQNGFHRVSKEKSLCLVAVTEHIWFMIPLPGLPVN